MTNIYRCGWLVWMSSIQWLIRRCLIIQLKLDSIQRTTMRKIRLNSFQHIFTTRLWSEIRWDNRLNRGKWNLLFCFRWFLTSGFLTIINSVIKCILCIFYLPFVYIVSIKCIIHNFIIILIASPSRNWIVLIIIIIIGIYIRIIVMW